MSGRLLLDSQSSAAANMAVDESLLRHVQTPVLRFYGWEKPCVSIGYFQKASVVSPNTPFVRRYTGGLFVVLDDSFFAFLCLFGVHHGAYGAHAGVESGRGAGLDWWIFHH